VRHHIAFVQLEDKTVYVMLQMPIAEAVVGVVKIFWGNSPDSLCAVYVCHAVHELPRAVVHAFVDVLGQADVRPDLVGAECGAGADGVLYRPFFVAGEGLDLAFTRSHTQYYRLVFGFVTHIVLFGPCMFFSLSLVQALFALIAVNRVMFSGLSFLSVFQYFGEHELGDGASCG
jgi:hypothetical protein